MEMRVALPASSYLVVVAVIVLPRATCCKFGRGGCIIRPDKESRAGPPLISFFFILYMRTRLHPHNIKTVKVRFHPTLLLEKAAKGLLQPHEKRHALSLHHPFHTDVKPIDKC